VNLLDTAPAYGTSEERLGGLLRERGDREAWVISTKAGEEYDGESSFDFSPGAIIASCERSLRRLGTDRVDLLMIHSDGVQETRLDELGTFDALDELKRRGLARSTGVSYKTAEGARPAIERTDVVMVAYNLASPELGWTIDHARDRGVGVLVKKALVSGRVGGGHGVSAREALDYVFQRPVSSVVVGTVNPAHLRENVAAMPV
jgi:aryl-alcohol dehydrogenase-like predicted oxidoreductase